MKRPLLGLLALTLALAGGGGGEDSGVLGALALAEYAFAGHARERRSLPAT